MTFSNYQELKINIYFMKIRKYYQFIKEELNDSPENFIEMALNQLKRKIDKIFEYEEGEEPEESGEKSIEQAKKDSKKKDKMSFKDLGVRLESSEVSKYSKLYDNLTIKFSDNEFLYTLFITIDLKEGLPKTEEKPIMCDVKIKKYDLETFEVIGQLPNPLGGDKPEYKKIEINKIDEEYLVDLKIELDEKTGEEEKLEIETE
jgi:hypothetical protein